MKNYLNKIFSSFFTVFALCVGQENYSVHFDFMRGYAVSELNSQAIFGDNYTFTVEAWYKNDGVDSGNNQGYDDGANIVSSYKRSGGGDPYNNFSLAMIPHGNPGKISMSGGAISTDRYDDGEWHHIVLSLIHI